VVAACALALTVSTANATTYTVNIGTFPTHTVSRAPYTGDPTCNSLIPYYEQSTAGPITGTLEIDNGTLTAVDITVGGLGDSYQHLYGTAHTLSFTSDDNWTLTLLHTGNPGSELQLNDYGIGTATFTWWLDYPDPTLTFYGAGGPITTPLPAALPLFASGLGALGLLGWRRKKAAAG
jgi:hypothetical protein